MANFNVNIISGSVELREGDLLLVNSESTINVRTELNRKENITNRAYTLNAESTNDQYPTAKTVYDFVSSSVAEVPKVEEVWIRGEGSGSAVLSGSGNVASGQFAVAEGQYTTASGRYSHAEGERTAASGQYSHAEGRYTIASGSFSHAAGRYTTALGYHSHTEGDTTLAVGDHSHAEGERTAASGNFSHAEGSYTETSGSYSHAEGNCTSATGSYSHAEGGYTKTLGSCSHAEGYLTTASRDYSHAEGYRTAASGTFSHAEGSGSKALGSSSHAEGWNTIASNDHEHAQGQYNATASSQIFSIGVGDAYNRRKNAISIITGSNPTASIYIYGIDSYVGNNPVPGTNDLASVIAKISASAIPADLTGLFASASYSSDDKKIYFYDNNGTTSGEVDATAFIKDGMVNTVTIDTGSNQMIITFNTDAGKEDIALDLTQIFNPNNYYTKTDVDTLLTTMSVGDVNVIEAIEVNGTASAINNKTASINFELPDAPNQDAENWVTENSASIVTESIWVRGSGAGSAVLSGSNATATGQFTVAEGFLTTASGQYSHAEGSGSVALESGSHAEGYRAKASGSYSHAEGIGARAVGRYSHAEGSDTGAEGTCSHAEGWAAQALGNYSHAEGESVQAQGTNSHAEGAGTIASGTGSHTEGYRTRASGSYSHAEGSGSAASGLGAHAEGRITTASGMFSHAEGNYTFASGNYSHAEGNYTFASNIYEHAQGRYNATASSQIFSVGVGDRPSRRKNAISIITGSNPSASIYVYGVGSYNGTNPEPGVNDLATIISNISASSGGLTSESDPVYLADSASLKASASLAKSAIQPAATSSWAAAATWITANSASALAVSPASVTASINAAIGGITASHHTHSNKAVLDGITAAKTASWDNKLSSESDPIYLADSASLKNAATWLGSNSASLLTSESDPVYLADSASLKASASLAKTAIQPAATSSWATAATWVTNNSSSVHTHDNKTVLDGITAAKTASWEASGTLAKNLTAISASLIASGTLAKNVTAITASLVASASVAKTASSSAAAISAKTGSWDALVGLPAVTAADNGKILRVVNGAWALVDPVTVYSGQGAPDSALGQDGDIYLQS